MTKHLTLAEAADMIRCSSMTLRRAIHDGKLPAYKRAGKITINPADFHKWIEQGRVAPLMDYRLRVAR